MKKVIWTAAACLTTIMLGGAPALAGDTVNTGYFGGIAIMGYDPVAYFTEGRAMKGSEEFAYDWLGTPWHFASRKHRDLFVSEPVKYAPQFGGYCAGEVAFEGITVNIDPDAWRIIEGKLYLYGDKTYGLLPDDWQSKAEANWPKLVTNLNHGKYY